MLQGDEGEALRLAMRVVTRIATAMGADSLLNITGAHIDSCLFHGHAQLDFARRLAEFGAEVVVPTTLNVASLDLLHPDLYRGDPATAMHARALMDHFVRMGCEPTWTCAPYQLPARPKFGEHIAWAESNAIVFANSVLGARTHRYGDFIDICAAITGRAPAAGLHLDENRRGEVVIALRGVSDDLLNRDVLYPVLGHLVGVRAGSRIPVITGLPPDVSEDRLKALGAAAASSGAVGMFHAVGSTPEASSLDAALGGLAPEETVVVGMGQLRQAWSALSTSSETSELGVVSLGTPHYSIHEFAHLVSILDGRRTKVPMYVSTGRAVADDLDRRGWSDQLSAAGIQLVTDTCTYVTPIIAELSGIAMTDSAKWAYYAPGNLGLDVVFGSTEDCVESAMAGFVTRDRGIWGG